MKLILLIIILLNTITISYMFHLSGTLSKKEKKRINKKHKK